MMIGARRRSAAMSGVFSKITTSSSGAMSTSSLSLVDKGKGRLRIMSSASIAAYVTAVGVDLVETPQEASLDLSRPLLPQRPWCVETASLSKTAIVARGAGPIVWAPGFHAATVAPSFDDLLLLHMKFADIKGRVAWFAAMLGNLSAGSSTYEYYSAGKAKIEGFAAHLNSFPKVEDADPCSDTAFRERFMATVTQNPVNGIWQGDFEVDRRRIRHRIEGLL